MICPDCKGRGSIELHVVGRKSDGSGISEHRVQGCALCAGFGSIHPDLVAKIEKVLVDRIAGREMAEDRKARKMSLREEAKRLGITPQELNNKEWGRV